MRSIKVSRAQRGKKKMVTVIVGMKTYGKEGKILFPKLKKQLKFSKEVKCLQSRRDCSLENSLSEVPLCYCRWAYLCLIQVLISRKPLKVLHNISLVEAQ